MLTDAHIDRYSRHILLREVGGVGQEKLLRACVRVDRLDEDGRALALWLARAGVGALALPDDESPAPASDRSGLLLACDAGRPLLEAVRERLRFHAPHLAFHEGWTHSAEGSSAGARLALEVVRSVVGA